MTRILRQLVAWTDRHKWLSRVFGVLLFFAGVYVMIIGLETLAGLLVGMGVALFASTFIPKD